MSSHNSRSVALPEIDHDKCTGCGDCVELCRTEAVDLLEGKAVIVRPQDCDYCTDCEGFCPFGAIRCPFEILVVNEGPLP